MRGYGVFYVSTMKFGYVSIVLFLAGLCATCYVAQAQPRVSASEKQVYIILDEPPEYSVDEIRRDTWIKIFVGDTLPHRDLHIPPIVGQISVRGDSIVFSPFIAFRENQPYTLVWRNKDIVHFQIASQQFSPPPVLKEVFPTASVIPANQLKFYVYFSSPMQEGKAYEYINILDQNGNILPSPFVPLQPELWDETHTRLTLWLDPGRVKRGLGSHEKHGEILQPNDTILFQVLAGWENMKGQAIPRDYTCAYTIGDYDRTSPEPGIWGLEIPAALSEDTLKIHLGESLDRVLLEKYLSIVDDYHEEISGTVVILDEEKIWAFVPDTQWKKGKYSIVINTFLEDLAGNNVNRLFDRDIAVDSYTEDHGEHVYLLFEVE